jgi:hypothetical protein
MLDQLLREMKENRPTLPKDIGAHEVLQMVYRGEISITPQQLSAAKEAIAYEKPKLTAVATAELDGNSFAELLDKAIERQERAKHPPKLIDVTPVDPHPASELKGPFARLRRRV